MLVLQQLLKEQINASKHSDAKVLPLVTLFRVPKVSYKQRHL